MWGKKTVDINIPGTSGNGDRKVMQYIRIMSRPPPLEQKNGPSWASSDEHQPK